MMLLRTSSNPSMLMGTTGVKDVEMESPTHFSSPPFIHLNSGEQNEGEWDFEGDVVPWPKIRRAQSENDLQNLGRSLQNLGRSYTSPAKFVAGGFALQQSCSTPQKQWSRRTSLRRHSSLPSLASGHGMLEEVLAPLSDVIESSNLDAEEEEEERRQMGGASVSGRWETECFRDQDGEVYSGMSKDANGNTVLCSSKGCRPLHDSEKLEPMFIAGGLGSGAGMGDNPSSHFSSGGGSGSNADAYFRSMLETNPGEPLLMRNYARFLHEVLQDHSKAEEYYERAILANPNEGELLAEYAKLEWDLHGDEDRAGIYFDQAVHAAPDNCYVLGAYAAFLWECEEKEKEALKKHHNFEKQVIYARAAVISA